MDHTISIAYNGVGNVSNTCHTHDNMMLFIPFLQTFIFANDESLVIFVIILYASQLDYMLDYINGSN